MIILQCDVCKVIFKRPPHQELSNNDILGTHTKGAGTPSFEFRVVCEELDGHICPLCLTTIVFEQVRL